MKVLSNIPIVAKMMLVVALMGVLSLGITAYNSFETAKLDSSYSRLTDKLFPALVKLARANRNVSALMYAGYRAVAYDGGSAEGKRAGADREKASKSAHKLFAEARTLAPEKASHIKAFEERFSALDAVVTEATRLGLADDNAAAAALMQRADKQASALTTDMAAFNDAVIAETDRLSARNSAAASKALWIEWGGGIAGLILASATAIWLVRAQVSGPLLRLSDRMTALSNGKLDVEVEGAERGDEVGRMARSVLVFKENGLKLKAAEADAERQAVAAEEQRRKAEAEREAAARALAQVVEALAGGLAAVADGDLTAELGANFASEYERLRNDFNAAVGKLRDTLGVINTAGEGIRAGAGEISQASDDLSRRTEQQAASLEETAAALDEITATVRRTAEAAQQARSVVAGAKNDAEQTEHVVKEAVGAMGQIEASSRQISTIIGVIDEIAFQTNLLALNAGVEAARAGDAGKGFAVVASEVRALAQRSAEAAKEIKDLISTSGAQVTAGVELVGSAGEALSRILRHVTDINGLVGEIAASAQEQASGLQQVNTAVNQMDQVTQQNAAMVEEATAAARSLSDESRNMSDLIARFRLNGQPSGASAPRAVVQLRPSRQAKPDPAPSAEAAADWTEF